MRVENVVNTEEIMRRVINSLRGISEQCVRMVWACNVLFTNYSYYSEVKLQYVMQIKNLKYYYIYERTRELIYSMEQSPS
jgi:hypothetical protein